MIDSFIISNNLVIFFIISEKRSELYAIFDSFDPANATVKYNYKRARMAQPTVLDEFVPGSMVKALEEVNNGRSLVDQPTSSEEFVTGAMEKALEEKAPMALVEDDFEELGNIRSIEARRGVFRGSGARSARGIRGTTARGKGIGGARAKGRGVGQERGNEGMLFGLFIFLHFIYNAILFAPPHVALEIVMSVVEMYRSLEHYSHYTNFFMAIKKTTFWGKRMIICLKCVKKYAELRLI